MSATTPRNNIINFSISISTSGSATVHQSTNDSPSIHLGVPQSLQTTPYMAQSIQTPQIISRKRSSNPTDESSGTPNKHRLSMVDSSTQTMQITIFKKREHAIAVEQPAHLLSPKETIPGAVYVVTESYFAPDVYELEKRDHSNP